MLPYSFIFISLMSFYSQSFFIPENISIFNLPVNSVEYINSNNHLPLSDSLFRTVYVWRDIHGDSGIAYFKNHIPKNATAKRGFMP